MGKGLIFFCCSCAILLFTIINISIGPIISGKVGEEPENWGTANCKALKDRYDVKKEDPNCNDDCLKYGAGWDLNFCNNGKAIFELLKRFFFLTYLSFLSSNLYPIPLTALILTFESISFSFLLINVIYTSTLLYSASLSYPQILSNKFSLDRI